MKTHSTLPLDEGEVYVCGGGTICLIHLQAGFGSCKPKMQ